MSELAQKLKEIAERQKALEEEKVSLRETAIADIKEQIEVLGLKPADIFDASVLAPQVIRSIDGERRKVAPKYGYQGQYWTGRGIMPKWMAKLLEEGHKQEEFLINKE